MKTRNRMIRIVDEVCAPPVAVLVNANESLSVVASDNHTIARAQSILIGIVGHPGRLTPEQANDVLRWHATGAKTPESAA